MPKIKKLPLTLAALAATFSGAYAGPAAASRAMATEIYQQRAEDVLALFQGSQKEAEVFAPGFLNAVPPVRMRETARQLVAQYGPATGIVIVSPTSPYDGIVEYQFARARVSVSLAIEHAPPGRVTALDVSGVAKPVR